MLGATDSSDFSPVCTMQFRSHDSSARFTKTAFRSFHHAKEATNKEPKQAPAARFKFRLKPGSLQIEQAPMKKNKDPQSQSL